MNPLTAQFVTEARELLAGVDRRLLQLEKTPEDTALMGELFRIVHTLKGNSGLFDFPEMQKVLHAGEDLMDAVREGHRGFDRSLADALLSAMDFVLVLCTEVEDERPMTPERIADADRVTGQLRSLLGPEAAAEASPVSESLSSTPAEFPGWEDLPEELTFAARTSLRRGRPWSGIVYRPDEGCYYQGTDPFHLSRQLPGLKWGSVSARGAEVPLADLDAYRCRFDFLAVSDAKPAALKDHLRYVSDQVVVFELPAPPEPAMVAEVLASQREILSIADQAPWRGGRYRSVAAVLSRIARSRGDEEAAEAVAGALERTLSADDPSSLVHWLDAFEGLKTAAEGPGAPARFQGRSEDALGESKTLRVDQGKIDRLMNLIGEMAVAKNALPYLARRTEEVYGQRELSREIRGHFAVLHRITTAMQEEILQIRMLPMSFVFQRFPRLVREVSHRLGKEVELVLEGEETEADKAVLGALADPLMHVVRNSLDHGIESPEVRRAAGKPAQGRLVIAASQEADRVIIEITDDGKGIDPAAVRAKAVEKGLIDQARADRMSDQESVELVFAAGLSTAAAVSDLSGRGVGMDVVRAAVEQVNGTLELTSQVGVGTRLRLTLPLSMAMTQVMVIEAGGQAFGIPVDQVVETVRLPDADVRTIKTHRAALLRGEVIPLSPLADLLSLDGEPRPNEAGEWAVLVARAGAGTVGLVIDGFRGTTEIIQKPLQGVLGRIGAYSGSALLGDGSVLLVLNLKEVA